jgi:hypothetical protein
VDIRKIALVTFIVSILASVAPLWNLTQTMVATVSRQAVSAWWFIPTALFTFLATTIEPLFFFALHRNRGALRFPRRMKLLSRAAAFLLGLFVVAALWTEFLDPGFTARGGWGGGQARTIGHIVSLLNMLFNATLVLLLVSFNLNTNQESAPDIPVSRFLDQTTKIAVIFSGIVLAFLLIRCLLSPYTYSVFKDFAIRNGRTTPSFSALLEPAIRDFVLQACAFAVPFVVFRREPVAFAWDGEPSVIAS